MPKPATWDVHLRRRPKLEHGQGWSLSKQAGKVKLTRRHRDGTRSSVMLDWDWGPSSASQIAGAVSRLRALMAERNPSLLEAHQLTFTLGCGSEGIP